MSRVEILQRVQQLALRRLRHVGRPVEVQNGIARRAQDGALVGGGHVTARPVLRAADRPAGRIEHHHEAGEVFVHAAKTVVHPRAETRTARENLAGVHLQHRRAVDGRIGDHRVNERNVIDAGGEMREETAHLLAALAILLELPLGADDPAFVLPAAPTKRLHLNGLSIEPVKLGLVVEGVDVAGPAIHEQEDHTARLAGKMRLLRREGIGKRRGCRRCRACEKFVETQQSGQRQAGEAATGFPEEFAPRPPTKATGAGIGRRRFGVHEGARNQSR